MGHLLVGHTSVGERNHPIDHGRLEGAIVEEGCERLEQSRRCGRIALARVDPNSPALMMIEVNKVEADPAVTHRCDLDLSAADVLTPSAPARTWVRRPCRRSPVHRAVRCASHNGIEGLAFEDEEIVYSALLLVNPIGVDVGQPR